MNAQTEIRASHSRWSAWATLGAIAVWAVVICAGWFWQQRHDLEVNAPLAHGFVDQWPTESAIARQAGQPTLVVFIHPQCPCTRATMAELEQLITSLSDTLPEAPDTVVVSTVPAAADEAWINTDTVAQAKQLVGARLLIDREGREAARFGATTSGTVMLFDVDGKRQYVGGVTASRGHDGNNVGRDTVARILSGQPVGIHEMPTFGCRLCLPDNSGQLTLIESTNATSHPPAAASRRKKSDVIQPNP